MEKRRDRTNSTVKVGNDPNFHENTKLELEIVQYPPGNNWFYCPNLSLKNPIQMIVYIYYIAAIIVPKIEFGEFPL